VHGEVKYEKWHTWSTCGVGGGCGVLHAACCLLQDDSWQPAEAEAK